MRKKILFLMTLAFALVSTRAQTSLSTFERPNFTGNWEGIRPWLSENGVQLQPNVSTFTGSVIKDNSGKLEFGGKADFYLSVNGEKLGLWKGLNLISHTEYNFGKSVNGQMGTLLPQNTALFFPGIKDKDRFDITSLYILQKIGRNKALMAGKINMVDIAAGTKFVGGAGIDTFEHINFVAPPSGLVPPYIFGALFSIKTQPMSYTFGVYDPINAVNKTGLEAPFKKGVTFYGSLEKPVKIAGKTGSHSIKAVYSTQNGVSLSNLSDIIIHPELINDIPTKKDRYYFGYSFHQHLVQRKDNPAKGWGVFGNVGFSDADPTPLDWSFIVGIGGNSLFKNRSEDNWGVGFFHQSITNSLRNTVTLLNRNLQDENGVEIFYNYQIAPWFKLGINGKVINPALSQNYAHNSFFIGLRSSIKL